MAPGSGRALWEVGAAGGTDLFWKVRPMQQHLCPQGGRRSQADKGLPLGRREAPKRAISSTNTGVVVTWTQAHYLLALWP